MLSMNWFRSEKSKELEMLKVEEQKLKIKLLEEKIDELVSFKAYDKEEEVEKKLYSSIKLVNDVLTIVEVDGNILSKSGASVEDYLTVKNAKTYEEVLSVISDPALVKEQEKHKKEVEKAKAIVKGLDSLAILSDFNVIDGSVYIKGIHRSIPELLVNSFLEIIGEYGNEPVELIEKHLLENIQYMSLKKFWLKCCLNPNAKSAEDLYTFLTHHQFKIDRHGNFYAYRNVVSKNDAVDKTLVEFISNAYNKVKAVWKKSPIYFNVWQEDDASYIIHKVSVQTDGINKLVGNLKSLYEALPTMSANSYTDAHTHSFDYRIGKVMSMPRHMGNDNNTISCSKGSK